MSHLRTQILYICTYVAPRICVPYICSWCRRRWRINGSRVEGYSWWAAFSSFICGEITVCESKWVKINRTFYLIISVKSYIGSRQKHGVYILTPMCLLISDPYKLRIVVLYKTRDDVDRLPLTRGHPLYSIVCCCAVVVVFLRAHNIALVTFRWHHHRRVVHRISIFNHFPNEAI